MGVKGMLETCARCDKTIFLKHIETCSSDGGYSKWDKFEQLPEEWSHHTGFGCLCPDCTSLLKKTLIEFYGYDKAPYWCKEYESLI